MRFFKEQNYIIFLIYMFYTTFYNCDILCPRDGRSGGILLLFCLSFCPPLWNFNLAHNFWTASARDFIFHMSIHCDKTFPWVPLFLPCDFDLGVWPIFENFNLADKFWTMSASDCIFHMNIAWDKTNMYLWVLLFFTLDLKVWPIFWKL